MLLCSRPALSTIRYFLLRLHGYFFSPNQHIDSVADWKEKGGSSVFLYSASKVSDVFIFTFFTFKGAVRCKSKRELCYRMAFSSFVIQVICAPIAKSIQCSTTK